MSGGSGIKPNPKALLPIAVFLVLYLGTGIYFEYIAPEKGRMGFYVMSVVVAFGFALIVAFLQNRKLSFDEKIKVCAQGIGDDKPFKAQLFRSGRLDADPVFRQAQRFSGIGSHALNERKYHDRFSKRVS